ncbi:MAG TPA: hypothetical protein VFU30_02790 [Gaiellaceae bacterium]|nr:hypothetical protein [Gaiellaceae bacterium]
MTRANVGAAIAIAAAGLAVGALVGQPGSGQAAGNAPVSSAPPTISGTAQQGQTLSASKGGWSNGPTTFAYAWSQCDATGGACTPISGATAATYTAAAGDVGHTLRVTVTATNDGGSGKATSAQSAVITKTTAPTPTTAPSISGTPQAGATLTASKGTWSGNPTAITLQWMRCDANGDSCAAIVGATSDTYAVTQADAGRTLRIAVTATNADGATEFVSAQTAAVPGADGCPAGTGTINIADLDKPARLDISKASISPNLITLSTHTIQLHFTVTACNGRPVSGASVFATPIPYNQFAGATKLTAADGTVTITETRQRGFPARKRHQHLLAVFARASKQGDPILGGVSTRRTVAFQVNLP